MRILLVSQYYRPERAFLVFGLAEGLAARGHSVRVLTGYPNYPEGTIYEGYRQKWRSRENIRGIDVCRVPLFIDHSPSALRRTLNYVSFGLSATTARRFSRGADVIYVYATQMTAATGPWLWRILGGAPYVLHIQDLWPDSVTGSSLVRGRWRARLLNVLLARWIRSVYKHSTAIVAIAPQMIETLVHRGVARKKLHLVFNWARQVRRPLEDAPYRQRSRCTVLFAGNIGDLQDLETAVQAAHRLRCSGLTLRIVGTGVALPRISALAERLGVTNVEFVERVEPERMPSIYAQAHYSLVTLRDLRAFEGTIPSKYQASLANGVPVITTVRGDVRRLTEERGLGFTADPESVESLESAFRRALAQSDDDWQAMAERSLKVYREEFSYEAALASLEEILADAQIVRSAGNGE